MPVPKMKIIDISDFIRNMHCYFLIDEIPFFDIIVNNYSIMV